MKYIKCSEYIAIFLFKHDQTFFVGKHYQTSNILTCIIQLVFTPTLNRGVLAN